MFCCDSLATCEAPLIPDVTQSKCMAKAVQEVRAQASAVFPCQLISLQHIWFVPSVPCDRFHIRVVYETGAPSQKCKKSPKNAKNAKNTQTSGFTVVFFFLVEGVQGARYVTTTSIPGE
jgi:hypothetical protein